MGPAPHSAAGIDKGPRLAPEALPPRPTTPPGNRPGLRPPAQPHSEKPQTWHFMHPSANSSWLLHSGQVPMKVSPGS